MAIPTLIGFERSFAGWDAISDRAAYTGYVAEPICARTDERRGKDEVDRLGRAAARSARRC